MAKVFDVPAQEFVSRLTEILKNEDKIKTFYVDMLSKDIIFLMWKKINQKMNIIIDDGFHSFEANTIFFENSLSQWTI